MIVIMITRDRHNYVYILELVRNHELRSKTYILYDFKKKYKIPYYPYINYNINNVIRSDFLRFRQYYTCYE